MPGTSFELWPAKQTAHAGKADITVANHGTSPLTITTRTVLLKSGCKYDTVNGVHVVRSIRLAAGQQKTVKVSTGNVHGDVGIVFTPESSSSGFTQSGSIGAQVLTGSSAQSCVAPRVNAAAGPGGGGHLGMMLLIVFAVFIVAVMAAVSLVMRRRRSRPRHRTVSAHPHRAR